MLVYFFTKPPQGNIDSLKITPMILSQERVEKDIIQDNKGKRMDGQKTNKITSGTVKITYADIIMKRKLF